MHRYALITPTRTGSDGNPGHHFITAGIMHLIRHADAQAVFVEINMLEPDAAWHAARETCRAAIFCGNPRLNCDERRVFWDWDIWQRIESFQVPLIDAWAGAAHPWPLDSVDRMAARMRALQKTRDILELERSSRLIIARDPLAHELLAAVNPRTVLAPCSSWWARHEMGVEPQHHRHRNAIVLRWIADWQVPQVRRWNSALQDYGPPVVITTHIECWREWSRRLPDLKVDLITHPRELLRILSSCDRVLSFRLHATLPALSLGCAVADVASDSRSLTLQPFGLGGNSLDAFYSGHDLQFERASDPQAAPIIDALRQTFNDLPEVPNAHDPL